MTQLYSLLANKAEKDGLYFCYKDIMNPFIGTKIVGLQ